MRPKITPTINLSKRTCTVKGTVIPKNYTHNDDINVGIGKVREINTKAEFEKLIGEFSRKELMSMNLEGIAIKNDHYPWDNYNLKNQDYYIGKVIKQNNNFPQLDITGQIYPQSGVNKTRDRQKKDVCEKLKNGKYCDFSSGHVASYEFDPVKNTLKVTKELFEVSLTEEGAREGSYLTDIDFGQNDLDDNTIQNIEKSQCNNFKTASTSTTVKLGKDSSELLDYLFPKNDFNSNNEDVKVNRLIKNNNSDNNNSVRIGSKNLLYTYSFKNKTKNHLEIKMASAPPTQATVNDDTGVMTIAKEKYYGLITENEKYKASHEKYIALEEENRQKNIDEFNNNLQFTLDATAKSLMGDKKFEELPEAIQQQITRYEQISTSYAEDYKKALETPDGKIDSSKVLDTLQSTMANNKEIVQCFSKKLNQLTKSNISLQNQLAKFNSTTATVPPSSQPQTNAAVPPTTTTTTTTTAPTTQNKPQTNSTILNSASVQKEENKKSVPTVLAPRLYSTTRRQAADPNTVSTSSQKVIAQTQVIDTGAGVGRPQSETAAAAPATQTAPAPPTKEQINGAISQQTILNSSYKRQKVEFNKTFDDEEEDEDNDDGAANFSFTSNPFEQLMNKSNNVLYNKGAQ